MRKYNTATVQHVTMQKKTQETASKQAEENDTFKNTNEPNQREWLTHFDSLGYYHTVTL